MVCFCDFSKIHGAPFVFLGVLEIPWVSLSVLWESLEVLGDPMVVPLGSPWGVLGDPPLEVSGLLAEGPKGTEDAEGSLGGSGGVLGALVNLVAWGGPWVRRRGAYIDMFLVSAMF